MYQSWLQRNQVPGPSPSSRSLLEATLGLLLLLAASLGRCGLGGLGRGVGLLGLVGVGVLA
jgi:hypothetical protein